MPWRVQQSKLAFFCDIAYTKNMRNRRDLAYHRNRALISYLDGNKAHIEKTNVLIAELRTKATEFANMNVITDDASVHVESIRGVLNALVEEDYETFQETITSFNSLMTMGSFAACLQATSMLTTTADVWQDAHYIGERKQASLTIIREQVAAAEKAT